MPREHYSSNSSPSDDSFDLLKAEREQGRGTLQAIRFDRKTLPFELSAQPGHGMKIGDAQPSQVQRISFIRIAPKAPSNHPFPNHNALLVVHRKLSESTDALAEAIHKLYADLFICAALHYLNRLLTHSSKNSPKDRPRPTP